MYNQIISLVSILSILYRTTNFGFYNFLGYSFIRIPIGIASFLYECPLKRQTQTEALSGIRQNAFLHMLQHRDYDYAV